MVKKYKDALTFLDHYGYKSIEYSIISITDEGQIKIQVNKIKKSKKLLLKTLIAYQKIKMKFLKVLTKTMN